MKKLLMWTAMMLLSCVGMFAQKTFNVTGTLVDKETGEAVVAATVQLLALPDSSFVDGKTTGEQGVFNFKEVKKGTYTLKLSFVGYVTKYVDVDLTAQKKSNVEIGYITMSADAILLEGAKVTAHAAKVAVSGDSLVYSALAYRVPEGSTLEALVKQLPGAKVDKDGNITINGKKVSKILVDGKEFFLNDKEVAMKNIPTEMIEKLKTYDRKSDLSRVTGIDDGEKETVLDLTVKKGMKNGWFGNVNLGAGTEKRYAERFNVNRFNDDFQATVLGGANNVADMGYGGGGGRWGGWGGGLRNSKDVGANFATDKPKLETGGSVRYRYDGSDTENTSSTEYFNASLARFNEDFSKDFTSSQRVSGNFRLEWKPDTMTNIIFRPDVTYSRSRGRGYSSSASYSGDPNDTILNHLMDMVVNTNANRNMSYSANTSMDGELQMNRKFNSKGRNLTLRVNGSYSDGKDKQLSAANITYNSLGTDQQNNRYYETPAKNWSIEGMLTYSEPIADRTYLQLSYSYEYSYSKNDRRAYIYESDAYQTLSESMQGNRYNINAVLRFMDEMKYVLDGTDSVANRLSQFSEYRNYNQTINLSFRKVREKYNFSMGLDFLPQRTTLNYKYMGYTYPEITRNVFNIAPRVNLRWNFDKQTNLFVRYNGRTRQPSMTNLLDITDDSNPLNITKGNPGLKPSFSHNINFNFNTFQMDHYRSIFTWGNFSTTRNSVANRTSYNETTGVRTTKPENINGNWNASIGGGFNTSLDSNNYFSMNTFTNFSYNHQVSYLDPTQYTEDKSKTNTTSVSENLGFDFRKNWFEAGINGSVSYNTSRNSVVKTGNMETWNFSYGAEINLIFDNGLSFSTDISESSRRGYSSASMNTNELLWNAQVAKSFLKGNALTVSLQWNDILKNRSNISRAIDAYQSSDSRYNAIYSYGMLHVIYKLNIFGGKNSNGTENARSMWGGFGGGFPGGGGGNRGGGGGGRRR